MRLRAPGARTALNGILPHSSHPITTNSINGNSAVWITDDLLRDSFERFSYRARPRSCQNRRHGSTVPGPLEARRRQAKRRLNNLAAVRGDDLVSLDQSVLKFSWLWNGSPSSWHVARSTEEPEWTWLAPKPWQKRQEESSLAAADPLVQINKILDSILLPKENSDTLGQSRDVPWSIEQAQHELSSISNDEFRIQLNVVDSLNALRSLFQRLGSTPLDAFTCSKIALAHLLRRDVPVTEILEFLDDSRFNVASSSNLVRVFHHFRSHVVDPTDFGYLLRLLERAISQQALHPKQLLRIILCIPDIIMNVYESSDQAAKQDVIAKVCACIRDSNYRVANDVNMLGLAVSLKRLAILSAKFEDGAILMEVLRLAGHIWETNLHSATSGIFKEIFAQAVKSFWMIGEQERATSTLFLSTDSSKQQSLLRDFPSDLLEHAGIQITRDLADEALRNDSSIGGTNITRLNNWLAELRRLEFHWLNHRLWTEIYTLLAPDFTPVLLHDHLNSLNYSDRCRVLLRHWTRHDIETTQLRRVQMVEGISDQNSTEEVLEEVERRFDVIRSKRSAKGQPKAGAAYLVLLKALKQCKQPCSTTLTRMLELSLIGQKYGTFEFLVLAAKRLLAIQINDKHLEVIAKFINLAGSTHPRSAYEVFRAQKQLYLSHCPTLLVDCIAATGGVLHPQDLCALLDKNDRFAVRSLKGQTSATSATKISHQEPASTQQFPKESRYSYERIEMVHKAAIAFAYSDRITTNTAWCAVYRCWQYILAGGSGVPLDSRLSNALIHTGIVRPLVRGGRRVPGRRVKHSQTSEAPNLHRTKFESGSVRLERFLVIKQAVMKIDGHERAEQLDLDTKAQVDRYFSTPASRLGLIRKK